MSARAASRANPDVMIDINTTPLIDVMLVLLVMLIITIPIQLHSVNLNMPTGNPPPPLVKPEVVKLDIDFDGTIYWNGEILRQPDGARGEADMRLPQRRCSPKFICVPTSWPSTRRRAGDGLGAAARRDQDRHRRQRAIRALVKLSRRRR